MARSAASTPALAPAASSYEQRTSPAAWALLVATLALLGAAVVRVSNADRLRGRTPGARG